MNRKLPEGYTVRYTHGRFQRGAHDHMVKPDKPEVSRTIQLASELHKKGLEPDPIGGYTHATIFDPDGVEVAGAYAWCRVPDVSRSGRPRPGDNFSKKLGQLISLGRALKKLEAGVA